MTIRQVPNIPLLDLDLLKTLVAISETGNFSEAARAVYRTPSAVSMQVKRLEELLGRSIFVRGPRTVSLNEDGKALLTHARRVLALNRDIVAQFIQPDVCGTVRVGAIDHAVDRFLPSILCRFSDSHPGITVNVVVENSDILFQKILAKELDVAIVTCSTSAPDDLEIEELYQEKLVWAGLKGGVAVEQTPLPVSVWEEGCVWRSTALTGLEKQNRDYRITFQSVHIAGQKAGILADLAIAPFPVSACDDHIVQLDDRYGLPPLADYMLALVVRPDTGAAVEAVADKIRAVLEKPRPAASQVQEVNGLA